MGLCRLMRWTYDEYLDQPLWFLDELINQLNKENREREKQLRQTNHG